MFVDQVFNYFLNISRKQNFILLGIFVTLVGFFIGQLLFPNDILAGVFFTTMPLLPLATKIFHIKISNSEIAVIYGLLFVGMMVTFALILPLFNKTSDITIYDKDKIQNEDHFLTFSFIITNNVRIVFILFLLSMLYGIGSFFILTLNAALISQLFATFTVNGRFDLFISFLPHATLEFISFFLAAIAGAILAVAFTAHEKQDKVFEQRVLKASIFFSFSVMIIIIAAMVESFALPYMLGIV